MNRRDEASRRSLATAFDPAANSINALRLALASAVLVSHGIKFLHDEVDPVGRFTGTGVDLGTMAVDGFFALSGFLVTRSALTSRSVGRYLWRRCLRILPAFWVCLLVTAGGFVPLAAALDDGSSVGDVRLTGPDSAVSYVTANAGLLMRQSAIDGLLDGDPLNGSLHTLFYEFLCYLMVGALAAFAVLRTRPALVLVLLACWWAFAAAEAANGGALTAGHPARELMMRFGLMFVVGAAMQLYGRHVPLRMTLGGIAVVVLAASLVWAPAYLLLAPPAVAYLLLSLGRRRWLAWVGARRDLSYGLYLYAWPVQLLLLLIGAESLGIGVFLVASMVCALFLAWLSWTLVERPALSLKSWSPPMSRWRGERA